MYDGNDDDNYVKTLTDAFKKQFGKRFQLASQSYAYGGTKKSAEPERQHTLFSPAVEGICQAKADVIFFAGRDRDLPAFIQALSKRGECGHNKPIAIMTATTGLGWARSSLGIQLESNISVIAASSTYAAGWGRQKQAPAGYRAFHDYFRNILKLPEDSLTDGYAIMHHDALATAIYATRLTAKDMSDTPTNKDVYLNLTNLHGTNTVPAASGNLSFDGSSDRWPHCKPIPIIQLPATVTLPKNYEDYVTPCPPK